MLSGGIWHGWWQLRNDGIVFADLTDDEDPAAAKGVFFYSFRTRQQQKIAQLSGDLNPNITTSTSLPT